MQCGGNPYSDCIPRNVRCSRGMQYTREGEAVAEIRIEEKKRGAPWVLILLLVIVAAIIGWWLWSSRASGTDTTGTPSGAVADSSATKTP